MGARAESTAATRRSIVDAFTVLFAEQHYGDITLDAVAARAGVSVQTVIRHFGSKDSLFAAAAQEFSEDEEGARAASPVGDPAAVVRFIVGRYERNGDAVLALLAQEARLAPLLAAAEEGRGFHHDWVARVFAEHLDSLDHGARRVRHGQLVALTDVYVWKLLRRDMGFGRRRTEKAMTETIVALMHGGT